MKKLTRERAVPIILAKVSWLTLGITASGFPSFPKLANSNRSRQSFFARIKKLIDEIFFNTNIARQQV
jgi:hypothetical protein